jgi:thiamine biosynthesis lipoprotein
MVKPLGPDCNAGTTVERTAWLMGTSLRVEACAANRVDGVAAIETVFGAVRETEARLSTWRADSDLSRLNDGPVLDWVAVSPATASILREVSAWSEETGGAFDPAVGAALDAWDLRGEGRVPGDAELVAATSSVGSAAWEIDDLRPRVRRLVATRLDAGGFGKGAGLRAAVDSIERHALESIVLDFGGQLVVRGTDAAAGRAIAVAHPQRRDDPAVLLWLANLSAATTSASERHVETSAGRVGHVLDPRSGRPVPGWGSVTVVHADPLVADILSTALFVMGPDEALRWSRARPDVGVLILEADSLGALVVRTNAALEDLATVRLPKEDR